MKAQIKTNVHNRFKIEVKDTKTNEIRQEGFAENIVLDRMYTRLVNFSTFFTYIHIGGGTGTLSPDRVALFDPITYKTATIDEKIKSYPVSSVTKKITFGTTEQNGKTFTEVGISDSTSAINTHALIKDAEGNPLTINKTDTDEITIYATIYFELIDDAEADGKFSKMPTNTLTNYVIDGSDMSPLLWVGTDGGENPYNVIYYRQDTHALTKTADVANKKVKYATRLDVNECNFDIREMTLGDILRLDLENIQSWGGHTLSDIKIGVGDGITKEFNLVRHDITNVSARVDGVAVSGFVLENLESLPNSLLKGQDSQHVMLYSSGPLTNIKTANNLPNEAFKVDPNLIMGNGVEFKLGGYGLIIPTTVKLEGSLDGETFVHLYDASYLGNETQILQYIFTEPYTHLRFEVTSINSNAAGVHYIKLFNHANPVIRFDSPPAEGAPVTVSYTVPYIPKTKDYVLDLELELLW